MNAERFSSGEYDDLQQIDFIRVCNLIVGQHFLMNGIWWTVSDISEGRLYYMSKKFRKRKESFGANNQMFVQIIKTPIKEV